MAIALAACPDAAVVDAGPDARQDGEGHARCDRAVRRLQQANSSDPLLRASCLARFVAGAEYLTDSRADRSSSSDDQRTGPIVGGGLLSCWLRVGYARC
jgi:hypothetical protein